MKKQLVVVGNGMSGVACVEQILKQPHDFEITIFGDETHANYNRILLSLVLAGEKSPEDIVINDIEWYQTHDIRARLGVKITGIDRERRVVSDEDGGDADGAPAGFDRRGIPQAQDRTSWHPRDASATDGSVVRQRTRGRTALCVG